MLHIGTVQADSSQSDADELIFEVCPLPLKPEFSAVQEHVFIGEGQAHVCGDDPVSLSSLQFSPNEGGFTHTGDV